MKTIQLTGVTFIDLYSHESDCMSYFEGKIGSKARKVIITPYGSIDLKELMDWVDKNLKGK